MDILVCWVGDDDGVFYWIGGGGIDVWVERCYIYIEYFFIFFYMMI